MPSERTPRVIKRESTGKRVYDQSRIRITCVITFFLLSFMAIGIRLAEVCLSGQERAGDTEVSDVVPHDNRMYKRSDIVDRNGVVLATSLATASVFVRPQVMSDREGAVKSLSRVLPDIDTKKILAEMKSKRRFVWIKRNLTPVEQQEVNGLGIPGLYFTPEERRVYPYGNLFSHVLGYVGVDDHGLAGLERHFDQKLRSEDTPLQVSLDLRVQTILHQEVERGMKEFSAMGGAGIIMHIPSGEIMGMVSLPDFDPHYPTRVQKQVLMNRASLGVYEMGSTFKSFTMAMALDAGTVSMRDGYDATNPLQVANFTIRDSHPKRRWLSVPEIYTYSSNIGTAKMIMDVGVKRQKDFLKRIGMFDKVPLEIPELAAPLQPPSWPDITMITVSYGHGLSVSPLHLVRGIATLVNGGTLQKMTLIKGADDHAETGERIIKEETSRNIRRLMRLVVEHGTGSRAGTPGYRVGGKTGTAEKAQAGGYARHANLSSFIAAFPMDHPEFVVLVMLDEPQGNKETFGYATAGWNAAPVAGRVISRLGPLAGIRPVFDVPEDDANRYWVEAENRNVHAVAY